MMLSCDIEGGDVGGGVEIDGLDNETMGVVRLNGLMQNSGPVPHHPQTEQQMPVSLYDKQVPFPIFP